MFRELYDAVPGIVILSIGIGIFWFAAVLWIAVDSLLVPVRRRNREVLEIWHRCYGDGRIGLRQRVSVKLRPAIILRRFHSLSQRILPEQEAIDRLLVVMGRNSTVTGLRRRMGSFRREVRLEAVTHCVTLRLGGEERIRPVLERIVLADPRRVIRIRALTALAEAEETAILEDLFSSLAAEPEWYRRQVAGRLSLYGPVVTPVMVRQFARWSAGSGEERRRVLTVLVGLAGVLRTPELRDAVSALTTDGDTEIKRVAVTTLTEEYGLAIRDDAVLRDPATAGVALRSLALRGSGSDHLRILGLAGERVLTPLVQDAFLSASQQSPELFEWLVRRFRDSPDNSEADVIAPVLGARIRYLLDRRDARRVVPRVMEALFRLGRVEQIIAIVSRRTPETMEPFLVACLTEHFPAYPSEARRIAAGIPERLAAGLGLKLPEPDEYREERFSGNLREKVYLAASLVILLSAVAGVFLIRQAPVLRDHAVGWNIGYAVIRYTRSFAWYSFTIHGIYAILAVLALLNASRQMREWRLRVSRYLYAPGVLPPVTILVPAHNEEQSVAENVRNLLRLDYPDHRILVVSDGSIDGTMAVLTAEFSLERSGMEASGDLPTRTVRAVYRSRLVPNLTVIDKEGGGKADALNVGINYCDTPLFCTIDADSLVESEAIVRAVYRNLLSDREAVAVGGTVMPVNGSRVTSGWVHDPAVGSSPLAALQMVEYLRAFASGRMGWAFLDSLLIISGAFGVFSRRRVVEAGGYLTSSSWYHRATMGEDMELVVRLVRQMRRARRPFAVNYSLQSVCWTEVPERFSIVYRQRRRWHRGLIDILLFHRRMAFNPRFGRTGLVALPYFLIFELWGPFLEFLGYVSLLLAAVLGILNGETALLVFSGAILFGLLLSTLSIAVAQRGVVELPFPSVLKLLLLAFLENFGYRQTVSAFRVFAYLGYIVKSSSWQQPKRKGFTR